MYAIPVLLYSVSAEQICPAKKDDNPEEALKDFRAIVDQETEQGDWCELNLFRRGLLFTLEVQGIQGAQAIYKAAFPDPKTTYGCPQDICSITNVHQICCDS